eukprot:scaffold468_cov216-Pinguiococcus_pyrenoidosus.AAC.9
MDPDAPDFLPHVLSRLKRLHREALEEDEEEAELEEAIFVALATNQTNGEPFDAAFGAERTHQRKRRYSVPRHIVMRPFERAKRTILQDYLGENPVYDDVAFQQVLPANAFRLALRVHVGFGLLVL